MLARRSILGLVLGVATACGGSPAPVAPITTTLHPATPADCSTLRATADRAHGEGRLDTTIRLLREASERCPSDAANARLASVTGEIARADGDGAAMLAKARAALAAGRPAEARAGFSRALAAFEKERGTKVHVGTPEPAYTAVTSVGEKSVAFAREREILVYDVPSFTLRRRLVVPEHGEGIYVRTMAMSRDGSKLAASYGTGSIVVWDVEKAKIGARIDAFAKAVYALAWAGNTLIAGAETLRSFDAAGNALATAPSKGGVLALAVLPKGDRVVVAGAKGVLVIHDVAKLGVVRSISTSAGTISALEPSVDGQVLAVSFEDIPDASIQLVDLGTGRKTRGFSLVSSGSLSPDGKLLAGSYETGMQVFDLARGTPIASEKSLHFARFLADGTLIALDEEGTVVTFDPKTMAKKVVAPVARAPKRFIFGPETRVVVGTRSGIEICDFAPKLECRELTGLYRDVAWDAKATTLAAIREDDGSVEVWNGRLERTHRLLDHPKDHMIPQHNDRIAISSDGLRAVTEEYQLHVLDLKAGTDDAHLQKVKLDGHNGLALSPDGKLAAVTLGPHLGIYDLESTQKIAEVKTDGDPAALRFSDDGSVVAVGTRGTISLVDVATRAVSATTTVTAGKYGHVNAFAFSPNGRTLAVAFGHDAKLFDRSALAPGKRLGPFDGYVFGIDYRFDGKLLATTSPSEHVRLWTGEGEAVGWLGFVESDAAFAADPTREQVELYGKASRWLTCDLDGVMLPFEVCEDRVVREGLLR